MPRTLMVARKVRRPGLQSLKGGRRCGMARAKRTRSPHAELGAQADAGDNDAMYALIDLAHDAGLDPDDYPTWTDLAADLDASPQLRPTPVPAIRTEGLSK